MPQRWPYPFPLIETMPLSQVNEAMDKVIANQARYRIVLVSENNG